MGDADIPSEEFLVVADTHKHVFMRGRERDVFDHVRVSSKGDGILESKGLRVLGIRNRVELAFRGRLWRGELVHKVRA